MAMQRALTESRLSLTRAGKRALAPLFMAAALCAMSPDAHANAYPGNENRGALNTALSASPNFSQVNLVDKPIPGGLNINIQSPQKDESMLTYIMLGLFGIMAAGTIMNLIMQRNAQKRMTNMAMGKDKKGIRLQKSTVRMKDVVGIDEAKEDIEELLDYIKNPVKYKRLGGRGARGYLLDGGPGVGKTYLVKALAGEADVPFIAVSGSDFVELFVGAGAKHVRELFAEAKKHAEKENKTVIIFIDEIDAVGRARSASATSGNDEREQTLNQLLVELDGFETSDKVVVIAATNRPDLLDTALTRPGRIDNRINVPAPDISGRAKILEVHGNKVKLGMDVDLMSIAKGTPGFSGAELANVINNAALSAARKGRNCVTQMDLEMAKDREILGKEMRSQIMNEKTKTMVAWHEAGHAIVGKLDPHADEIYVATIIPRPKSSGHVMFLPSESHAVRASLLAKMRVGAAGRLSEEIKFTRNHVSIGASGDLKQNRHIAEKMVTEWGMASEKLGFMNFNPDSPISQKTRQLIDQEIQDLTTQTYEDARKILIDNWGQVERVANALLEYETLTSAEIDVIRLGGKITRKIGEPLSLPKRDETENELSSDTPLSVPPKTITTTAPGPG